MRSILSRGERRSGRVIRAFTLVELLVVVTIIGLLVALLVPALTTVWRTAHMTQCKSNLNRIWQAQAVWRSEYGDRLLDGAAWMGRLAPYLESDASIFMCQAREAYGVGPGSGGGGSGSSGGGGSEGGDPSSSGDYAQPDDPYAPYTGDDSGWTPTSDEVECMFEFDIYLQEGSTGVDPGQGSASGIRGPYVYSIPLGTHPWVAKSERGGVTVYNIDDAAKGNTTKDDLEVHIHYENGEPTKVDCIRSSGYTSWSLTRRFIVDFKVFGEVLVRDWVKHYGESWDLTADGSGGGSSGGGSSGSTGGSGGSGDGAGYVWDGANWVEKKVTRTVQIVLGDYAISRGTYETTQARLVSGVDGRLFYILDYGFAKPIADFNHDGAEDDWDKYFIEDIDQWQEDFGAECADWRRYQSLRHFGRANVLFCDGHIETLGPDELDYQSPLWRYEGR